jgi:hypothetical protein
MGLRLLDDGGDDSIARAAFEHAGMALESLLVKGETGDNTRSFNYVIAGAAYHLARYSARAYSLLVHGQRDGSFSPIEKCLCHLIMRDLAALEGEILAFRTNGQGRDSVIAADLEQQFDELDEDAPFPDNDGQSYVADALGTALIDTYLAGMGLFLFGVERGDEAFIIQARKRLQLALEVCAELNLCPQWWACKLTIHIIDDLWSSTFYQRLPLIPNSTHADAWATLRRHFIALLFRRVRAEIDLWPSQIEAAEKAVNEDEHIVASLPTSAGKTRIALLRAGEDRCGLCLLKPRPLFKERLSRSEKASQLCMAALERVLSRKTPWAREASSSRHRKSWILPYAMTQRFWIMLASSYSTKAI